jgi:hypothetical protein
MEYMVIVLLMVLVGRYHRNSTSLLKIEMEVDVDQYMENFVRYNPLTWFIHNLGVLVRNEVVGLQLVFLANVLVLHCQKMCTSTLAWWETWTWCRKPCMKSSPWEPVSLHTQDNDCCHTLIAIWLTLYQRNSSSPKDVKKFIKTKITRWHTWYAWNRA